MPQLEYFYAAHSAYAYLGSQRVMDIAKAANVKIIHKPYDLRRGMAGIGSSLIRERSPQHRAYFFKREIQRWSEERNAPLISYRPTHHDNDITLPNCVLIACQLKDGNIDGLAHAMLQAHWRDDADLADSDTLASLANNLGLDGAALLADADSEAVRSAYETNTNEAIERYVIGSPTYFVDGDMFYGQDRLEMVERALKKPYAGEWPIGD
ncbi:MAG: 2-hydroxychromene-2-carboxylate isomerase [Hyphomicrobiaceae bacterium]